jgi:hypothetical protein
MSGFVVFHIKSTVRIKFFNLESAAKRSTTCMNRNAGSVEYGYASEEAYQNTVVKMKKVKNLMTGVEIEIPSNTPRCCDPSTETFWSM